MKSRANGYGAACCTWATNSSDNGSVKKRPKRNPGFEEARALDAPLANQLASYAAALGANAPAVMAAYQALIKRLQQSGAGAEAPKEGERLPPFLLPNIDGQLVSSRDLLAQGPLVISFNRGNWCPFCWLELAALGDIADQVSALGATIVSITPETSAYNREIRDRLDLPFDFLTDLDNGYGLELGITMAISREVRELVEPRGIALTTYQNNDAWFVPLPAIFIVDRREIIRVAYINPDYRERFDPAPIPEILAALD